MNSGLLHQRAVLTEKQLTSQSFNIVKRKLLSQLDVQLPLVAGMSPLQSTAADISNKIMDKVAAVNY